MSVNSMDCSDPGNSSLYGFAIFGKAVFGRLWINKLYTSRITKTRLGPTNDVYHEFRSEVVTE